MQTDARFLDDIAKLAASALGTVQGARREAESLLRHRLEQLVANMDFVSREEFEVIRDMAAKARAENEALSKRIAELEARLMAAERDESANLAGPRRQKD